MKKMLNLLTTKVFIFDYGKYYFNLRKMLNLFLELRNSNFDDEKKLNNYNNVIKDIVIYLIF
jgi:hypothetical protein